MDFVLGLLLGAAAVVLIVVLVPEARLVLSRLSRRRQVPSADAVTARELAAQIQDIAPDLAGIIDEKPAVEPADVPGFIDHGTVSGPNSEREIRRRVKDPDARDFLLALNGWSPRRSSKEKTYGGSLERFVHNKFDSTEFIRWPKDIKLRLEADETKVAPDFCFRGRLLVEIKADLRTASATDRALGQAVRYLLAWKKNGPALLIVCGDSHPVYRALVHTYVTLWRRVLRIPVTAYFVRAESPDEVPTSVDPSEWRERELSEEELDP